MTLDLSLGLINDLLFISNMKQSARKPEIEGLKEFVKKHNLKHYIMQSNVEGGDIIAHNNKVFIGQGDRTNEDTFLEIGNGLILLIRIHVLYQKRSLTMEMSLSIFLRLSK